MISVATGRRHAQVAVDPAPHGRPVLQEEEQAQEREREREGERGEALDAVNHALDQRRDDLRDVVLDARVRARRARLVHAEIVQPAFDSVRARRGVLRDRGALCRDPGDHDDDHHRGDCRQREQHDYGPGGARHVAREPGYERAGHGRDDRPGDHRADDRLGRAQHPAEDGEQGQDAEQQPGHAPEIPQPARRGEHRDELSRLGRRELEQRHRRRRRFRVLAPSLEEVHG